LPLQLLDLFLGIRLARSEARPKDTCERKPANIHGKPELVLLRHAPERAPPVPGYERGQRMVPPGIGRLKEKGESALQLTKRWCAAELSRPELS